MKPLLNADDDWIESLRRYLYPKLHTPLSAIGDKIGVNLYAIGHVGEAQYVGKFAETEDAIEQEFDDRAERNPVAALKSLEDGRTSEGSWVVLHEHCPDLIENASSSTSRSSFERIEKLAASYMLTTKMIGEPRRSLTFVVRTLARRRASRRRRST